MNNIVIVAGPSAVGKTTVAWKMLEEYPRFEFVRSATTRERRTDTYSSEYIYITKEEFEDLIRTGGVLEYTEYAGAYYGTPRSEIDRIHSCGKVPLLILDIVGVHSLMKHKDISTCAVYIYDDLDVMQKRLHERYFADGETKEAVKRFNGRINQNRTDYKNLPNDISDFYATVKNGGDVAEAAKNLISVYKSFEAGIAKDNEKNLSVAKELQKSAM